MNILMMSNTYKPIVGGIEKSIEDFSEGYREKGHKVLIVAPVFRDMPENEDYVYRIPAIQNFNGTDFSVELPVPGVLNDILDKFKPDIVHSHHPFLVGDTALRVSAGLDIPLVFTYHTRYEMNTHYIPGDSRAFKKFVIELAGGYCDLSDKVIAPSESIKEILIDRGVTTEINVIPTGLKPSAFNKGDGCNIRERFDIPENSFVIGYLGRMAEEKNIGFLSEAVIEFMKRKGNAYFLVVGDGDLTPEIKKKIADAGMIKRTRFTGVLKGKDKNDAYHAMDVFVFASKSETQGIVLNEAMTAGVPVIGLDAPGVREVIEHEVNGYLIFQEKTKLFAERLEQFYKMEKEIKKAFIFKARETARYFDRRKSIQKTLELYKKAIEQKHINKESKNSMWEKAKRSIKKEMDIISNVVRSAGKAFNMKKDENEKE